MDLTAKKSIAGNISTISNEKSINNFSNNVIVNNNTTIKIQRNSFIVNSDNLRKNRHTVGNLNEISKNDLLSINKSCTYLGQEGNFMKFDKEEKLENNKNHKQILQQNEYELPKNVSRNLKDNIHISESCSLSQTEFILTNNCPNNFSNKNYAKFNNYIHYGNTLNTFDSLNGMYYEYLILFYVYLKP